MGVDVIPDDVDTISPTITSVSADSSEQVIVVFSEPVEELSATYALNYGINNGIMVYGASLGSDQKSVTLTTNSHSGGNYVLTVNNIEDLASIPNVIAVDTTVSYTFLNQLQITNLNVASGKAYQTVDNGLQNGARAYRITTKPSWLSSFTDTGDNLVTTDTTLSIFASDYLAGTITLGGNEGRYSMYTVVIVGQ